VNDKPVRLLVADDEFGVREGMRKILTSEGFEVVTAEDGQAALETFETQGSFQVALIDLMMPRLHGLELLKHLHQRDPDLVVIIITAHATIDSAVEGTKRGAYSYIPKPFTPEELLLSIRNGLERLHLTLEARRLREEREHRLLELASERSKSTSILKCMTDGLLVINFEKLIVLRNDAVARILSSCATRPVPFPLAELSCTEVRSSIEEVLQVKSPEILIREVQLGDQTYMVNISPVLEPDGNTSGAVAVFRDITELKALETAKSMFVSMVAHELKNPLAATEGWLSLLLSGLVKHDPQEERHMIERSLVRIKTLRTLVSELLNLTAIETGNFTLRRAPLDLVRIAKEAVESHRERAEASRIALELDGSGEGETGSVLADRDALLMVIGNLIDNAIKYTPEKGHVRVRVEQNGMYVRIVVQDDGIGIALEHVDRVFDEFFRVKNEHTASIPGTGLGLSLVRRITEMHHGQVSVESTPGRGSIFTISLPLS
jgi:two-component system phosphate regulon sensor histidine kinase PhoR